MIDRIGCDILNIDRVCKLLAYKKFLVKYFTVNEIKLFNLVKTNKENYIKKVASNLCVKEAFFKVVSNKINNFRFCDIEVLRDYQGKPYVDLYNELMYIKKHFNVHITISNERNTVVSFVILERIII